MGFVLEVKGSVADSVEGLYKINRIGLLCGIPVGIMVP